ncbi:hypothetical protein GGH92_008955 [Coemansia sp. RSA 2673]|nr:hypothetical protein GGH92_008955 [Coemansia sp. RSA 2673]
MALNVVMLERGTRYPVPLPNENFLYHCSGVKFELKLGDGYPGNSSAHKSPSGTAFVSNQRIVFLPKMSETGTIPPHEEELPGYDGPPPPLPNSTPTSAPPPSSSAHPEDSAPSYPSDAPPGYEQWDSKS